MLSRSVVIVEDEPETAEMFAEMARLSGYQVQKAYASRAAMALIAQEKPDVVVLDVMMPDVSGLEVLRFIRRDPRLAHTPVILVSARTLPADVKKGLEAGASAYLTKPVSYLDLVTAIKGVLEASRLKIGNL